ncbi:MAG: RsmB/NOP family class I SAM-dependent RNA methyltransferase [Spirochaetes bacterium]|nr:MAG: RsmB/NOP family class I SAM-dependent RNA methyltransferase [Spirochaetota bacterium]
MKLKGASGFEKYYSDLFGDRWPVLREALLEKPRKIAFSGGLKKPYFMDEASVMAACALEVESSDSILDMCAAPGGKTLVLAAKIGDGGKITSNDRSSARRSRLKKVLDDHLPREKRERVVVTGYDATRWCLYEREAYEKILLDVPCSSERHLLNSEKELETWSSSRTQRLSVQSFSMLASAFEVVKPGGVILYCTCTLSPQENDEVIRRLLHKRENAGIMNVSSPYGEETEYGLRILPDNAEGRGPIYFSKIKKLPLYKANAF